jgi:hypothetical protein
MQQHADTYAVVCGTCGSARLAVQSYEQYPTSRIVKSVGKPQILRRFGLPDASHLVSECVCVRESVFVCAC